ncbi:MAG: dynamin family protein [Deltaproteobacteria bacterium]|nr:dynamin family protein [Deltaproteobacteria bacterium]MBW2047699.1 dynamin family protein [Deltaproteobacteria bacterium]MBW2111753.1 dynamin family protein [Deltaproteobacteria bacterium]
METDTKPGQKLRSLEKHLRKENPMLVDAIQDFRRLDKIARRMGFLNRDQTYASQIAWWPLISVLGTFSAGKSTFINHYLEYPLQPTGTQAVDDRFTVICYTADRDVRVLPGIALNSDPRFPFYRMSRELEKVSPGEGGRVDSYLQLKTCPSDRLKGQIFIDSPGFDADAQRTATLRITDYIIDLSDLVLVFFDARHPEPGAMRDTLKHLVANTINRPDSSKFLYILNQIDTSARENNPEEVVGAWQRSIAQEGLTATRFYCIYIPEAAIPIEDEALRNRYETKRDRDMAEIHNRIRQVSLERAYRIVGTLESTVKEIRDKKVATLRESLHQWRRKVLWRDGAIITGLAGIYVMVGLWAGYLNRDQLVPPRIETYIADPLWRISLVITGIVIFLVIHFWDRKGAARQVLTALNDRAADADRDDMARALRKNLRPWRTIFNPQPIGWGSRADRQTRDILANVDRYVQTLNDSFATPSGRPGEWEKDRVEDELTADPG